MLSKAETANIEDVQIRFLHINHLILNKKAVNRTKDKVDGEYLEKIKNLLNKSGSMTPDIFIKERLSLTVFTPIQHPAGKC